MIKPEEKFEYRFITRHLNGIYLLLYLCIGLSLSVYGVTLDHAQLNLGLMVVWASLSPFIFLSALAENRSRLLYQSIELNAVDICGLVRGEHDKFLISNNRQYVPWKSINHIEHFKHPDPDSILNRGSNGIRLLTGDEKIVIWDSINNYDSLVRFIESRMPANK